MNIVIMALIPCLIFGMFNAGYQHYAAIRIVHLRTDVLALFIVDIILEPGQFAFGKDNLTISSGLLCSVD